MSKPKKEDQDQQLSQIRSKVTVPDVLVQDPARKCAYFITAEFLTPYMIKGDTWSQLTPNTVTFVIPDENYVEEAPPFAQVADGEPAVLIQFPRGKTAYHLSFEALQKFRIEQPTKQPEASISFIIPNGTELLEELPEITRSLLQNQEWG